MKVMLVGVFVVVFIIEVRKVIKNTKKYKTFEDILDSCDQYSGTDLIASILTIIACVVAIPLLMLV